MKNNLLLKRSNWTSRLMRFGFMLAALTTAGLASAQTTVTVGTGTSTTANAPITGYYGYSYSQNIYKASDMIAGGATMTGTISKIRFFYASGGTNNATNWTVYIGHTVKNGFISTTDWISTATLTNSFTGTVTYPAAGNWVEVTLTTPFQWNGVDNIVIAVDENQPAYSSSTLYWRYTGTGSDYRTIYYYSDSNNPNPASPPTASARQLYAPNLQFVWTGPPCAGAPSPATTTVNDAQICPGQTVNLGIAGGSTYSNITYEWQQNDGTGWTTMAGTASTNTATNPATMDYRVIQTCTNSGLTDTAAAVTVTMNTNPTVVINHTDIALCDSEPANLIASGADTYLWSPTTLLTPSATQDTVNVIPAATTTYTVTGTTTAGCTGTASVLVTPLPEARSSSSFSPAENCAPGSPITLSITDVPAEITSGGTWEYRFMAEDGTTVLQDWSASADYTFTPAIDGIYDFFYQMRSTACVAYNIDSVKATIIVGFGADSVATTNFNCNSDGILKMIGTYGQADIEEIYSNPLSDVATMTDFALLNSATVTGGRLVLTPSATSISGYATLTVPGFVPGLNNAMKVSFDMTADQPINNWGTGGGDGICYSFGNDATPAANGSGHNGKGTKLRLSFDGAANAENGNVPGIYLVYGWTGTVPFGPASAQTLAYSSNTSLWKVQQDVPVTMDINTNGQVTVTVGGVVVFENIQLPASYLAEDVTNWKHLFSAQTGGDALRHAIANLTIEKGSLYYGITDGGATLAPSSWQSGTTFADLLPGTYDLWISKNETGTCLKNIGTFEVLNTNPIVDLGNDTTLCEGETLMLNAGNAGSTYVWSGNNAYTQTLEVTEAGSYVVHITDPVGCTGISTINVDYNEMPAATGIYAQGSFPMMSFSVLGAQNAATYDWNFGDGNSVQNGPASVSHFYTQDGTFTVSVTLTNDCGTTTETTSITIIDYTGVGENTIEGLEVYPNPSSSIVNISIPNAENSEFRVFSISGAEVVGATAFNSKTKVDVSAWESGVYFLTVTNGGITTTQKVVVE